MFVSYCIPKHEEYIKDTIYKIRLDTCVVSSFLRYGVDTIWIQLFLNTRRIHSCQDTFSYPDTYVFCRIQHTVRILNEYAQDTRTRYTHIDNTLIVAHIYLLEYWRTFRYVHRIRSHRHSLTQTFIVATPFGSGIAGIRAHDTCTGYAGYAHRIRRIRDAATI